MCLLPMKYHPRILIKPFTAFVPRVADPRVAIFWKVCKMGCGLSSRTKQDKYFAETALNRNSANSMDRQERLY